MTAKILYFPLTADPAGYHHLLLAECALRQNPGVEKVVFLLSNGRHPDPSKRREIMDGEIRLKLFRQTLEGFNDPQASYPCKLALEAGSPLRLKKGNWEISTIEFRQKRPVRLAEHVLRILDKRAAAKSGARPDADLKAKGPLNGGQDARAPRELPLNGGQDARAPRELPSPRARILTGADLLQRMLDPGIFTEADLGILARHSLLLTVPRGDQDIDEILSRVKDKRGVELQVRTLDPSLQPASLRMLFNLSSTIIRRAVQAGESLQSFMPESSAKLLTMQKLYLNGITSNQLNEWQLRCAELETLLEKASHDLLNLLDRRQQNGQPHTLCVVETGTGGRIAAAFSAAPGASRHFVLGLVPYGREAQKQLLEDSSDELPTVSRESAEALAIAGRNRSGADWTLAETGMAGPLSPARRSRKNGLCYVALCGKPETDRHHSISSQNSHQIECNPFFSKKEHQLLFALHALEWMIQQVQPLPL